MSDELKNEAEEVRPLTATEVEITWRDEHRSRYSYAYLRRRCRCANCINEWTNEPILDPQSVSDDIEVRRIDPVGHYAIKFEFRDGHDSGIYAWDYLRKICPCDGCRKG